MSIIENLKLRVRDSISIAGDLLTTMQETPTWYDPVDKHIGYILDMTNLTYAVPVEIVNHYPTSKDLINDMEIRYFNMSMIDISQRASAIYTNREIFGIRTDVRAVNV